MVLNNNTIISIKIIVTSKVIHPYNPFFLIRPLILTNTRILIRILNHKKTSFKLTNMNNNNSIPSKQITFLWPTTSAYSAKTTSTLKVNVGLIIQYWPTQTLNQQCTPPHLSTNPPLIYLIWVILYPTSHQSLIMTIIHHHPLLTVMAVRLFPKTI